LFIGVIDVEDLKSYDEQNELGAFDNTEAIRIQFRLMGHLAKHTILWSISMDRLDGQRSFGHLQEG
jgi:hypothetical protein